MIILSRLQRKGLLFADLRWRESEANLFRRGKNPQRSLRCSKDKIQNSIILNVDFWQRKKNILQVLWPIFPQVGEYLRARQRPQEAKI